MKDYYQILGVARAATEEEIKKAYRKLAHQYHPDKKGGNEAKFKEINEAYQVLSDQEKRSRYDRFGSADGFAGGGAPNWGGFDFSGFGQGGVEMGDLNDIFETFFDGMGGARRRPTVRRGNDLELIEEITLQEAFRGMMKDVAIRTQIACETCRGKGGDPEAGTKACAVCNGRGEVKEERRTFFGSFSQVRACSTCSGFGQIPNKMCGTCKGSGRTTGERKLKIEILPGIQDNQIIKIKGAGEAGERGTEAGDLYVRIRVKPHPVFLRRGDDLVVKCNVTPLDLLAHAPIEIPTIDGGKKSVEIPAGFDLKDYLRVSGEGMPRFGGFGRGGILVDFVITAPKKPSAKAQKLIEGLRGEL